MSKSLQFTADTIDGQIQEFPKLFYFPCDQVIPLGVSVVKSFDQELNIVAKRVFLLQYQTQSFGSSQFESLSDFNQYISAYCQCCPAKCIVLVNGCNLQLNGCDFVLDEIEAGECDFIVNGCNLTINGCNAAFS